MIENKVRIEAYRTTNQKYYKDEDKLFDRRDATFEDIFKTFKQMQELAKVSGIHYDVIVSFSTDEDKSYE